MNLDRVLQSIVTIDATVPDDGFTAERLGTKRTGSGAVIRSDGLVLTIGYLITEAESIWLTDSNGRVSPAHALAYDQETGFALVQALGRLDLPALEFGAAEAASRGDAVVLASGGRQFVRAKIISRQEFSGRWEYLLDEAIFTAPAHPAWSGAGVIGEDGRLLGVASLLMQQMSEAGPQDLNMSVPIDLLPPILDDLLAYGRVNKPPRPWLGLHTAEDDDHLVVSGLTAGGPAAEAGLRTGDIISSIRNLAVESQADFYRKIWSSGPAGVEIPVEVVRKGRTLWLRIKSGDRASYLKKPHYQ